MNEPLVLRYTTHTPERVAQIVQEISYSAPESVGSRALDGSKNRLVWLSLWSIFAFEFFLGFVVPVEPGFTPVHLVSYVLILSSYVFLFLAARKQWQSGALQRLPSISRQIWISMMIWGTYSALRILDFHDFRNFAYQWVANNTNGIWLMPLAFIIGLSRSSLETTFRVIRTQTALGAVIMALAFTLDYDRALWASFSETSLIYGTGIMFLISHRASWRVHSFWCFAFGIYGVGQFLLGLRNGLVRCAVYLFFYVVIQGIDTFRGKVSYPKFLGICLVIVFIIIGTYGFIGLNPDASVSAGLSMYKITGMYDSRSANILEMLDSLSAIELFQGSWDGTYWSGIFNICRSDIEGGFFQFILRGGLVSLVIFIILAFTALWKGLRADTGSMSFYLGLYILEHLIWMITYGNPGVNMDFILLWIAIGACLSGAGDFVIDETGLDHGQPPAEAGSKGFSEKARVYAYPRSVFE